MIDEHGFHSPDTDIPDMLFWLDSGWAWLVKEGDKVAISKSPNAENPLAEGQTPLLTMDVWGTPPAAVPPI